MLSLSPILQFCAVTYFARMAHSFESGPKLFVDIDSISKIDPLKHGFHIVLTDEIVEHYLNPAHFPTVYLTVTPLESRYIGNRVGKIVFRDEIQLNLIKVEGLQPKSWYYVCVEFENLVRHHHYRGNTSTSCEMARTLDQFGKSTSNLLVDVIAERIQNTEIDFNVTIEKVLFALRLTMFFEQGSIPTQSYLIQPGDSPNIIAKFFHLSPGFNYGRICVQAEPFIEMQYTSMGRLTRLTNGQAAYQCYLDGLKTEALLKGSDNDRAALHYLSHQAKSNNANLKFVNSATNFCIYTFMLICQTFAIHFILSLHTN